MDPNGNIYEAHPDAIPPEDKARLDGYLKARAEADRAALARARVEELEWRLADAAATHEGGSDDGG